MVQPSAIGKPLRHAEGSVVHRAQTEQKSRQFILSETVVRPGAVAVHYENGAIHVLAKLLLAYTGECDVIYSAEE